MNNFNQLTQKISKFIIIFTVIFSISSIFTPNKAQAMSPKGKAFLILTGYGAAGGGLLGLATMAFGEDSMAIARGTSLGMYAGMIFGGYVILSHKYRKKPGDPIEPPAPGEYQDPYSPYQETDEEPSGYDDFFGGAPQKVMQYEERRLQQEKFQSSLFETKKGEAANPPLYLNLINLNF